MGYIQTKVRKSVYTFMAEVAVAPSVYIVVRKEDSMDTLEEVNEDAKSIGKSFHFTFSKHDMKRFSSRAPSFSYSFSDRDF